MFSSPKFLGNLENSAGGWRPGARAQPRSNEAIRNMLAQMQQASPSAQAQQTGN